MEKETKPYQLTCLISPLLNKEKLEETIQNLKKWITDKGGILSKKETATNGGRRRLAYPVKKQREAFYLALNFLSPPQLINGLSQYLNLEKDIIRYFIVSQPKPASSSARETTAHKKPILDNGYLTRQVGTEKGIPPLKTPTRPSPFREEKEEKGKVKIEELDKKLEEILSQ